MYVLVYVVAEDVTSRVTNGRPYLLVDKRIARATRIDLLQYLRQ